MSINLVSPSEVGYGDTVHLDGASYQVHSIEGPDICGAFDLYLVDQEGTPYHRIITEAIQLDL